MTTTTDPIEKYRYTDSDRIDFGLVDEGIREGEIIREADHPRKWENAIFILAIRDARKVLLDMNERVVGY